MTNSDLLFGPSPNTTLMPTGGVFDTIGSLAGRIAASVTAFFKPVSARSAIQNTPGKQETLPSAKTLASKDACPSAGDGSEKITLPDDASCSSMPSATDGSGLAPAQPDSGPSAEVSSESMPAEKLQKDNAPQASGETDADLKEKLAIAIRKAVPAFPLEVFPEHLRKMVVTIACIFKVDLVIPAMGFLMLACAYIGRSYFFMFGRFKELCRLWVILVAQSSTGKSPAIDYLFGGFHVHNDIEPDGEGGLAVSVQACDHLTNTTMAGLLDALQDAPTGVFLHSDEIVDALAEIRKGNGMPMLANAFDGRPIHKRRSRNYDGDNDIEEPCLSIFGGTQAAVLPSVFSEKEGRQGYADRFIKIWSSKFIKGIAYGDTLPSEDLDAALETLHARLAGMLKESYADGVFSQVEVKLEPKAQAQLQNWADRNDMEKEEWDNSSKYRIFGKLPLQMTSSILALYALDSCMTEGPESKQINEDLVRRGIMLADWYLKNAMFCQRLVEISNVQHSPVEIAVAKAIVLNQNVLLKNKGILPAAELTKLANLHLSEPVNGKTIGKVASRLGIERRDSAKERRRVIYPSDIERLILILVTAPSGPKERPIGVLALDD
ncbi:MAG: DUF3987 domain-containing protein [Mailhella sp.]|nr:DUF3987 domain-containing protein [Mailhella sp.]